MLASSPAQPCSAASYFHNWPLQSGSGGGEDSWANCISARLLPFLLGFSQEGLFGAPAPGASEPLSQRPGERVAALAAPLPALPHPRKKSRDRTCQAATVLGAPLPWTFWKS